MNNFDKEVVQLTELTSVDTANDKVPIHDNSDTTELKYVTPNNLIPDASDIVKGKLEIATTDETTTGTDATRAVSPDSLNDMTDLSNKSWFLDEDDMSSDDATKTVSQQSVKAYVDSNGGGFNQGFMNNGKIVPSVSSNNLTVALKTLAGTDPSSSDPVKVRIGDTVRTISSALSVTVNAGANTFNAGSTELATQEADYFTYLGYNATDGVVLGFSRIPGASQYGDFSSTATNEKYAAISTTTNAASTDYYEVVGRFAATNSGTASYNWSIPTFTAKNLIQYPIHETRFLDWSPTYSGNGSLTYTSVTTAKSQYKMQYSEMFVVISTSAGTTGGSANNIIYFTTPFAAVDTNTRTGAVVQDSNLTSGFMFFNTTSQIAVRKYDSSNYGLGSSRLIHGQVTLEI